MRAIRYLESSTLVAALLERDAEALASIRELGTRVTSTMTFVEAQRAIIRAQRTGRLTVAGARSAGRALRTLERRVAVVQVSDAILDRVRRPFLVEPVRTLDGLHLATLELFGDAPGDVTVLTRDARIRANAVAMGFAVE
jgi:hypothetical protein